jgi:hypothetical protein
MTETGSGVGEETPTQNRGRARVIRNAAGEHRLTAPEPPAIIRDRDVLS